MTTDTASAPTQPRADSGPSGLRKLFSGPVGRSIGLVIALLVICIAGAVSAGDRFVDFGNLITILSQGAVIGVIAVGMTFVITAGGIDLSVGSVLGLTTIVASLTAVQAAASDSSWIIMVLIALAVGVAAGLVNGVVIAYGNVVAFMATLAMLVGARGLAELIGERRTFVVSEPGFRAFFRGDLLGVPVLVILFALVAVAGWFLLNRTTFGRRTVAIGGNREAARLAGVNVKRHLVYIYALAGLTAGIAGVMMMARTTSGTSTHGTLYELDAIAAVVVGGTLLIGGRGTIMGTVLGVLIFQTLTNVFTLNNLSTSVQAVVKGLIIVVAVLLQQRFANRSSSR